MSFETLIIVETPSAGVILIRPKRPEALSALNSQLLGELSAGLDAAGDDESVRCPGLNGGAQSMTVLHGAAARAGQRDRFLLEPLG